MLLLLYLYAFLLLYTFIFIFIYLYIPIYIYIILLLYTYFFISLSLYFFISLFLYLFISLFLYIFISLYLYFFISLYLYLISIYFYIPLHKYLPTISIYKNANIYSCFRYYYCALDFLLNFVGSIINFIYCDKKMEKIALECDYNNGAHPEVLRHLVETNDENAVGYGFDYWSEQARRKIREACELDEDAPVYFLSGGTLTNMTVIDSCIDSFGAVVCVDSGHINVHEAGAVEFTGHKVIALPGHEGKMDAEDLRKFCVTFFSDENADHMAWPQMVYITLPTELGTVYSVEEMEEISLICRRYHLQLYVDGARLGYALASGATDITLPRLAELCDIFYIGGTKQGALCGEAVVFTHHNEPAHFFTRVKQHGALMAKGRLCGVQFDALFTDDLYMRLSRHAVAMARKLKEKLLGMGFHLFVDSPTNQLFFIVPNDRVGELAERVRFECWQPYDEENTVCRFVTSWATKDVGAPPQPSPVGEGVPIG